MFKQSSFSLKEDSVLSTMVLSPTSLVRCWVFCLGGSSPLRRRFGPVDVLGSVTRPPCVVCSSPFFQAAKKHELLGLWLHQQDPILFLLVTGEAPAKKKAPGKLFLKLLGTGNSKSSFFFFFNPQRYISLGKRVSFWSTPEVESCPDSYLYFNFFLNACELSAQPTSSSG